MGVLLRALGKWWNASRALDFGTLQIDVTIEDAKGVYGTIYCQVMQQIMPDAELFESVCEGRDAVHYVGGSDSKQKAADQK